MKICEGRFSAEAVALLREGFAKYGWSAPETLDSYPYVVYGRVGLHAKDYADSGFLNRTTRRANV